MKNILILFLTIVLFGCSNNTHNSGYDKNNIHKTKEKSEKTYKFLVFYSNEYVDTVTIVTSKNVRVYSYEGSNYIGCGGMTNYLSTTAPIKMLNE